MARTKKRSKHETPTAFVKKYDNPRVILVFISILVIIVLAVSAYVRNGIYHSHVTLWADIAKRSPNKRRAHENYGQALSSAGYYPEALREFNTVKSLRDDGSVPPRDLYREIGVVYFRMGMFDEAIASWQVGLQYAPNDPSLSNNLSIALMQKGRFDEAAAQAMTALTMDPRMPQALNTMGQVYMTKNNYEKAVEYFLKALDSEPDVPARYWNVALAMAQEKKYETALQYAVKYASMESDPVGRQRAIEFIAYLKNAIKH